MKNRGEWAVENIIFELQNDRDISIAFDETRKNKGTRQNTMLSVPKHWHGCRYQVLKMDTHQDNYKVLMHLKSKKVFSKSVQVFNFDM